MRTYHEKENTKDKEMNVMPVIETLEYERVAYVKEMEEYLNNLKQMTRSEAKKISHDNLVKCQIIQENGEFTERYQCLKVDVPKKRK